MCILHFSSFRTHLLNSTNRSYVYGNMGVPLPEWAVVSIAKASDDGRSSSFPQSASGLNSSKTISSEESVSVSGNGKLAGVLWTFMDKGGERSLTGE